MNIKMKPKSKKKTDKNGGFKCSRCQMSFNRKDILIRHQRTIHSKNINKLHKCPFKNCNEQFARKDYIRRHIKSSHNVKDPSNYVPYTIRAPPTENSQKRRKGVDAVKESEKLKCPVDGCGKIIISRKFGLFDHIKVAHKKDPNKLFPGDAFDKMYPNYKYEARSGKRRSEGEVGVARESGRPTKRQRIRSPSPSSRDPLVSSEEEEVPSSDEDNQEEDLPKAPPTPEEAPESSSDEDVEEVDQEPVESMIEEPEEDDDDLSMEAEKDEDDAIDAIALCVFCCDAFNPKQDGDNFLESFRFNKFIVEMLPPPPRIGGEYEGGVGGDLFQMKHVTICGNCQSLINTAMGRKLEADEVEVRARKLQLQLLQEMRDLQRKLVLYKAEIGGIQKVVSSLDSDNRCLEGYFRRNGGNDQEKRIREKEGDLVLRLRNGIVSASNKLERRIGDLKTRYGSRISSPEESNKEMVSMAISENSDLNEDNDINEDPVEEDPEDRNQVIWTPTQSQDKADSSSFNDDLNDNVQIEIDSDSSSEEVEVINVASSPTSSYKSAHSSLDHEEDNKNDKHQGPAGAEDNDKPMTATSTTANGNPIPPSIPPPPDTSNWSTLKKTLLEACRKQERPFQYPPDRLEMPLSSTFLRTQSQSQASNISEDPRQNHRLHYNPSTDQFHIANHAILINETRKSLQCSICDLQISDSRLRRKPAWRLIQEHIQEVHLSEYHCQLCPSIFDTSKDHRVHMRDNHTLLVMGRPGSQNPPESENMASSTSSSVDYIRKTPDDDNPRSRLCSSRDLRHSSTFKRKSLEGTWSQRSSTSRMSADCQGRPSQLFL